jgi:hypothetical protein
MIAETNIEEAPLIKNIEKISGEKLSFYRKIFPRTKSNLNLIPKPHGGVRRAFT